MRRLLLVLTLLLPLAAAAQSSVYRHYAQRTDLTAVELQGFRLADTVRLDVVILEADDAKAWRRLCRQLNIRTTEGTVSWLAPVDKPSRRQRWNGGPCLKAIASHERRTVCFYLLRSEADYDALADYQMHLVDGKQ